MGEHALVSSDSSIDGSAADGQEDASESQLEVAVPEGATASNVVVVELQKAPEGARMFEDEASCGASAETPLSRTAPPVRPAWQASRYDNDRVMASVEEWLAARPDPDAPLSEAEALEYAALWRPASPQELAASAAQPPEPPPTALVAAQQAYEAWLAASPGAPVAERVAAKAAIYDAEGVW